MAAKKKAAKKGKKLSKSKILEPTKSLEWRMKVIN